MSTRYLCRTPKRPLCATDELGHLAVFCTSGHANCWPCFVLHPVTPVIDRVLFYIRSRQLLTVFCFTSGHAICWQCFVHLTTPTVDRVLYIRSCHLSTVLCTSDQANCWPCFVYPTMPTVDRVLYIRPRQLLTVFSTSDHAKRWRCFMHPITPTVARKTTLLIQRFKRTISFVIKIMPQMKLRVLVHSSISTKH